MSKDVDTWSPHKEVVNIREQLDRVAELSGWKNLSSYQQKIIEASLIIWKRSIRTTEPLSKGAILMPQAKGQSVVILTEGELIDMKAYVDDEVAARRYRHSQNHVARMSCFDAIAMLQNKNLRQELQELPIGFFDADYAQIGSMGGLVGFNKILDTQAPPTIVFISGDDSKRQTLLKDHAFLVLGKDKEGKRYVWEKRNPGEEYRILTLDQEWQVLKQSLRDRMDASYIGLRPLVQ